MSRLEYKDLLGSIYTRFSGNVSYGLDRMINLLEDMGNPQSLLNGFHVAGTNGKGSTSAMCEAIALADGKTCGLNTSPHLLDYRERFRVNGINISSEEIISAYLKWRPLLEKWQASFFEITTALAFSLFLEKKLDISIFEVGLGGRLDGTNPFNSTVTMITSISLDHKKTLGDSIEKIAFEKAGIIKERVPLVLGKMPPEALAVISQTAAGKNAPLFIYGRDYQVNRVELKAGIISEKNSQETDKPGTVFDLTVKSNRIPLPQEILRVKTNLLGQHQARNAALALISFSLYKRHLGEEINLEIMRKGLQQVKWLGRMQVIGNKPLSFLDCAHNEEGIENLVDNLKLLYPNKKLVFVVSILRDKNFRKMITNMSNVAKRIYIAKNNSDRAADPQEQVEIVRSNSIESFVCSSVTDAYQQAVKDSQADDIVVITGSIYTVSEVLQSQGD